MLSYVAARWCGRIAMLYASGPVKDRWGREPAGGLRRWGGMQQVRDNRSEQEFTLEVEGERAVAAYQREADVIVFTHTVVPPRIEGHGVGSRLVRGALDLVRDEGLRVVAQCPFVAAYIERHPEYRDLLAR